MLETKVIDVNTWNALIFIVTTLITVLLAVIAFYQKASNEEQKQFRKDVVHELSAMGKDMTQIKNTGVSMSKDVERIRKDVDNIENKLHDHEKRIHFLEKAS